MEMIEIKGGVAIFLSEYSGDGGILEFVVEKGPFIVESDHGFNAFLTLLLEQYGGGDLGGGVRYQCIVQTGYCPLFLWWE